MLHTCPVLDLKRQGAELELFDACYRVQADGMTAPHYAPIGLPTGGGVIEQPAKTMELLRWMEYVATDELQIEIDHQRRARQTHG